MNTEASTTNADEVEIRRLISAWSDALEAKDVEGLMADYAPDAVLFDAIPPYKKVGVESIREVWEHCLPFFPDAFKSEHRDIAIHVRGDTAFAFCVHHIIPDVSEHPAGQTWFRVTIGYQRIEGKWKVAHEHISLPFNPMNDKVWHIPDPDTLDMPDFSQGCSGGSEL